MRAVQLEQVEAGLGRRAAARRTNSSRIAVHLGAVSSRGTWLAGQYGQRRRARRAASCPSGSGSSMPSHISLVEPLRPECPSCDADLRVAVRVHEVDDRAPAGACSSRVQPGAAGRDAALRRDADHLGHHQPGAAERRAAQVDEVEVARQPVVGRVHVHRRDDDAVLQLQLAQPERSGTSAARGSVGAARARRRTTRRRAATNAGSRSAQVLVGDPAAAGEQVERELRRRPGRRSARCPRTTRGSPARRAGCDSDDRPALLLVGARAPRRGLGCSCRHGGERDRVLHRELRARADREVRRVRGVADQHDVAVRASVSLRTRREVEPLRVVRDQRGGRRARRRRARSQNAMDSSSLSPGAGRSPRCRRTRAASRPRASRR